MEVIMESKIEKLLEEREKGRIKWQK